MGLPQTKKARTNRTFSTRFIYVTLHCTVDLTAAEAPRTDVNMAGGAVYYSFNPLYIGLPCTVRTSMGMAHLNTKGNALVTKFTLGHLLHLLA